MQGALGAAIEQQVDGWRDRYRQCPHLGDLIARAEPDRNIILLARGESRREALDRLLPPCCYETGAGDDSPEQRGLYPAFTLGEKSQVSYSSGETLVRMPSSALAAVLPEIRGDIEFMRELMRVTLDERRVTSAHRGATSILRTLTVEALSEWPEEVQEQFLERLVMVVHFDHCNLRRLSEIDFKRHSCAVSLAKGHGRYEKAFRFGRSTQAGGEHTAIIIESFVRRSERETFVEARDLRSLRCQVAGEDWRFTFNPGGHPLSEVLVRRAIFPHRLLGIAVLLREDNQWRLLRYVANPYFDSLEDLTTDPHIPQELVVPRMLAEYEEYRRQLRLIYTHSPGRRPAYDDEATRDLLG